MVAPLGNRTLILQHRSERADSNQVSDWPPQAGPPTHKKEIVTKQKVCEQERGTHLAQLLQERRKLRLFSPSLTFPMFFVCDTRFNGCGAFQNPAELTRQKR